ncbi:Hypothetical predicted protein [Xyrichtys novacula]|uniref:Uncharacterized protein n=1 Tax=Xyrichtys novacula TaxID=13765 RepID=A0AAV1FEB9_XYRNO|nr:Hypothetical predicted protein [Xyrichtys novacula]
MSDSWARTAASQRTCSKLGKSPSLRLWVELHLGQRADIIQRQQCGKKKRGETSAVVDENQMKTWR